MMLIKRKAPKYHINPRFRAYGKARLDIARRAESRQDWDYLWKQSTFPFPFEWGEHWKQCIEYRVDDFAAEVGFFIDILGFPVNAFDPDYAMFTSPGRDFFFAVVPTPDGASSTPPDAIRLQFMINNLLQTAEELQRRGVKFERFPVPCQPGASLHIGQFRTPHGICVELWGMVESGAETGEDDDYPEDFEKNEAEDFQMKEPAESDEAVESENTEETQVADPSEEEAVEPETGLDFGLFSPRTNNKKTDLETEAITRKEEMEIENKPVDEETEEDPYSFLLADKVDDEEDDWNQDNDPVDVEYVDDDY
jgi:catechol 2,3-dioxygenase-like lactoylglutathione lyase family enzyme